MVRQVPRTDWIELGREAESVRAVAGLLREALAMPCAAEVARQDDRRIKIGLSIAKFPCVRTPGSFEFDAQPSVEPKQIRELATLSWVAAGASVLLLGPTGVDRRIWRWHSAARRLRVATRRCSCRRTAW